MFVKDHGSVKKQLLESENGGKQQDFFSDDDMGVSLNNGTPKWMVYNGKPY